MSEQTIIFFLLICIALLIWVILYQQFAFRSGIQTKLRKISGKLKEITDTDSDERVMVFTENKELMELAAQINRLLENHLKVKADYRRAEIASKKMLSNISHDIKTPMEEKRHWHTYPQRRNTGGCPLPVHVCLCLSWNRKRPRYWRTRCCPRQ